MKLTIFLQIGPMLSLINLELAHGNFPQVVALYEKALRGLGGSVGAAPGVEIWSKLAPLSRADALLTLSQNPIFTISADRTPFRLQDQPVLQTPTPFVKRSSGRMSWL